MLLFVLSGSNVSLPMFNIFLKCLLLFIRFNCMEIVLPSFRIICMVDFRFISLVYETKKANKFKMEKRKIHILSVM